MSAGETTQLDRFVAGKRSTTTNGGRGMTAGDNTARVVGPWDGQRATKCDHIRCDAEPILHVEVSSPRSGYAAEVDLCEEHLGFLTEQARAFLVSVGVIAPTNELERNIRAATEEHGVG